MDDLYSTYSNYVNSILLSGNISLFKNHPSYTYMLEHVSFTLGQEYLKLIQDEFHLSDVDIAIFCSKNDQIGSPVKMQYGTLVVSPTSLRYIYQALRILQHCKSVGYTTPSFVELGGGYGGLFLAIDHFMSRFDIIAKSYTIIDLEPIIRLQELYLSKHYVKTPISFHNAHTHGNAVTGNTNFLISNYCFSEINADAQKKYVEILFPKCNHGFITWNHIPIYDFGKKIHSELERPMTTQLIETPNYYVTF
jgi:hypothetical protein